MQRKIFDEDHESFRKTIRQFIEAEVVPHYEEWYAAGLVPRDFYAKLGELGVFSIEVPEEFGGAGLETFKYEAVMAAGADYLEPTLRERVEDVVLNRRAAAGERLVEIAETASSGAKDESRKL